MPFHVGLLRWVFTDPTPGADPATYTVPINPNQMTSPYSAPRAITTKTTTAVGGQSLVFEGATPPQEMTFQGTIFTEDHLNAMLTWRAKTAITTITDHFGRIWTVYWEDFQAIAAGSSQYPNKHTYTAKVLILGGPDGGV
jgi:hypothetical protein